MDDAETLPREFVRLKTLFLWGGGIAGIFLAVFVAGQYLQAMTTREPHHSTPALELAEPADECAIGVTPESASGETVQ